jgi:hypothetical protein
LILSFILRENLLSRSTSLSWRFVVANSTLRTFGIKFFLHKRRHYKTPTSTNSQSLQYKNTYSFQLRRGYGLHNLLPRYQPKPSEENLLQALNGFDLRRQLAMRREFEASISKFV